eukprot:GHVR01025682.1.p1 GENE.GHVR01025682.1~~GHVR01025682.1.p1  ORF type:complete len:268 (-),score=66.31 GHVR01025682.1:181-984(-)
MRNSFKTCITDSTRVAGPHFYISTILDPHCLCINGPCVNSPHAHAFISAASQVLKAFNIDAYAYRCQLSMWSKCLSYDFTFFDAVLHLANNTHTHTHINTHTQRKKRKVYANLSVAQATATASTGSLCAGLCTRTAVFCQWVNHIKNNYAGVIYLFFDPYECKPSIDPTESILPKYMGLKLRPSVFLLHNVSPWGGVGGAPHVIISNDMSYDTNSNNKRKNKTKETKETKECEEPQGVTNIVMLLSNIVVSSGGIVNKVTVGGIGGT